ncbi:hypothetical protein [Stenotrophomonas mori]|uniref:Uncharacterized protein n=1 Tax=Stenotrophomonas mori TaxID=2871096 RepID=A0ABT0SGA4_9GAMM|nr:hypothetical protein [Stenotrophomonas mori]MCL7714355.1 hypothetical protein [Stenotrophomonas mori]
MDAVTASLVIAVTGLPALAVAAWSSRDGSPQARGLGLRWALIALCLFVGALALYLADGHRTGTYAVITVLVLAINALGISLVLHLRRAPAGTPRR